MNRGHLGYVLMSPSCCCCQATLAGPPSAAGVPPIPIDPAVASTVNNALQPTPVMEEPSEKMDEDDALVKRGKENRR